jgi:hypothetical protein
MDNNKFDIKKAKDMNQRLADVKGIDEIKDEIENLIKMNSEYSQKVNQLYLINKITYIRI